MERANAESLKNRLQVLALLYNCDEEALTTCYLGKDKFGEFARLCDIFDTAFIDTTNFYYYMSDVHTLRNAENILKKGASMYDYSLGQQLSEKVARTREMLGKYPQGKYAEVGKMRKEALIRETGCKPEKTDFGSLINGLYAASVCYTDICAGTKDQFDHNDNNYLYLIRFMTEHRLMSDKLFNAGLSTINEYGLGNAFARDTKRYIQKKQRVKEKEEKRRKIEAKKKMVKDTKIQSKNATKLAKEGKVLYWGTIPLKGNLSTMSFVGAYIKNLILPRYRRLK